LGKPMSNGPDWIDVETMMRALGALHSGTVGLTVIPRGVAASGGLSVAATIFFDVLPGSQIPESVSHIKDWPCSAHATFAGHCYALLLELDYVIGRRYEQSELWN